MQKGLGADISLLAWYTALFLSLESSSDNIVGNDSWLATIQPLTNCRSSIRNQYLEPSLSAPAASPFPNADGVWVRGTQPRREKDKLCGGRELADHTLWGCVRAGLGRDADKSAVRGWMRITLRSTCLCVLGDEGTGCGNSREMNGGIWGSGLRMRM